MASDTFCAKVFKNGLTFLNRYIYAIYINYMVITLPTAKIISDKNARAWVSMVSYLKNKRKLKC